MTERINGQGFRPLETSGARRTEGAKSGAGQGTASAETGSPQVGETVNITRSALLLAKLEDVVRATPAVDANKVGAIKAAVSSGTYQIDDQSVADNMIRLDRELV
ncbi:MAG TPA: flagellar biosynthesis anti-sigma factor FlgM [Gammaproteobacteria bacterium]|nr:flagellar biosynthesis anti-sigma factor FlgM [Gammaproteobacteria bacterium]